MEKEQVLEQREKALNEMIRAKEEYCNMKEKTPFAMHAFDFILDANSSSYECCSGCLFVIIVAIPCLIYWQFEKAHLDKKANTIMLQAKKECKLYVQYLKEYMSIHPEYKMPMDASIAFINHRYIGKLQKEKAFFGLLQKEEDWRIYSIQMAMEEIKNHSDLL